MPNPDVSKSLTRSGPPLPGDSEVSREAIRASTSRHRFCGGFAVRLRLWRGQPAGPEAPQYQRLGVLGPDYISRALRAEARSTEGEGRVAHPHQASFACRPRIK